jgi:hypothetical protein
MAARELESAVRHLREKPDLSRRIKLIRAVQTGFENISVFPNFLLAAWPKSPLNSRHPVPLRGALRNVINAGRGCGGRGRRL